MNEAYSLPEIETIAFELWSLKRKVSEEKFSRTKTNLRSALMAADPKRARQLQRELRRFGIEL